MLIIHLYSSDWNFYSLVILVGILIGFSALLNHQSK